MKRKMKTTKAKKRAVIKKAKKIYKKKGTRTWASALKKSWKKIK